jgi:hypothetical protein
LRIIAGLPGLMLALGACGHASPSADPMTVPALDSQIDALNGQTVRVKGYLGICHSLECSLFTNKADSDLSERRTAAMWRHVEPLPPAPPALGIGNAEGFDSKADRLQHSPVLITGKVTNECRHSICTDRGADLFPTDIAPLKEI